MQNISRLRSALLLLSIAAVSCKPNHPGQADFVPEIKFVEAVNRTLPVYSEFNGQTFGLSDIDVVSRVEGWVTGIHFKEGDFVKQGQLLYTIDDSQLRNQEEAAASDLAQQEVLMARAKTDLERIEPLAEINAVSRRELDAARANYLAQQKSVEASRAFYRNAQLLTSYTRITAPISGVIGISNVLVGDMVSRSLDAKPLNTISSTGEIRIRFNISETDFLAFQRALQKGKDLRLSELSVYLSDGTLFPEKAKIDFTDRTLDTRTGSLLVQAVVPNNADIKLRPGQYVTVRAVSDELKDAVLIPQQAVMQLQTVYQVFVVGKDDTLRTRPVTPGVRIGSNWVITAGLEPGERVAMIGNAMIKPNSLVKTEPMTWSYDSTLAN
jgi:membrane fusion protein (multidrug efflux system)